MFKMRLFLISFMLPCWCEPPSLCRWIPAIAFLLSPWFCSCLFIQSIKNTTKRLIRSFENVSQMPAQNFPKTLCFTQNKSQSLHSDLESLLLLYYSSDSFSGHSPPYSPDSMFLFAPTNQTHLILGPLQRLLSHWKRCSPHWKHSSPEMASQLTLQPLVCSDAQWALPWASI